jgi:hypothetical protein
MYVYVCHLIIYVNFDAFIEDSIIRYSYFHIDINQWWMYSRVCWILIQRFKEASVNTIIIIIIAAVFEGVQLHQDNHVFFKYNYTEVCT